MQFLLRWRCCNQSRPSMWSTVSIWTSSRFPKPWFPSGPPVDVCSCLLPETVRNHWSWQYAWLEWAPAALTCSCCLVSGGCSATADMAFLSAVEGFDIFERRFCWLVCLAATPIAAPRWGRLQHHPLRLVWRWLILHLKWVLPCCLHRNGYRSRSCLRVRSASVSKWHCMLSFITPQTIQSHSMAFSACLKLYKWAKAHSS